MGLERTVFIPWGWPFKRMVMVRLTRSEIGWCDVAFEGRGFGFEALFKVILGQCRED